MKWRGDRHLELSISLLPGQVAYKLGLVEWYPFYIVPHRGKGKCCPSSCSDFTEFLEKTGYKSLGMAVHFAIVAR